MATPISRLDRIRAAFDEKGIDALLVSSPVEDSFGRNSQNRRYVSGFTGSWGYALITRDDALIALDFRYVEQGERECPPFGFRVFPTGPRKLDEWIPALVGEARLQGKRIGVSGADMNVQYYSAWQNALERMPSAERPALVPVTKVIEKLRQQKDAAEMAELQRAIDIADAAFEEVEASLEPGVTEREVAARVEAAVRRHGGDSVSFETIVAGGPWSAQPHAQPRDVPIEAGQPVVVDMGALAGGYCSDLTRTFTLGRPDARFNEIYEIVLAAQQNAIERVEPGMPGAFAHDLAWSVIDRVGYGDKFGHGLGHGVGLEIHEAPYLGKTSEDTLEEGMVFTIEPGIYLPGWGGIRIEDVVVLENGRARVLSHARKLIPAGV